MPYLSRHHLDGWVGDLKNHDEFNIPFVFPHGAYETANFEIISEAVTDHIFYATEKTYKSIVAKLPFMAISTAGYLGYLRSLGFETFGSIIDESYDQEPDLEKRITMIATEAKRIIDDGSQKFYDATRDICQHNYNNWAKNRGTWEHTMDNFLLNLLDL
jgi:CRISPR/Cas system CSM-associated protein Csm2 small subunit